MLGMSGFCWAITEAARTWSENRREEQYARDFWADRRKAEIERDNPPDVREEADV